MEVQTVIFLIIATTPATNEVDAQTILNLHPETALIQLILLWPEGDLHLLGEVRGSWHGTLYAAYLGSPTIYFCDP